MRPFGVWFGRLAMAGACLLEAGCGGGSDVPDPDSDSRAASAESAPRSLRRRGQEAEPESSPAPDPVALASNTPDREKPATAKADERPPEPEKAAPSLKGDASGTDEMMRMGGPAASAPAAPTAPGASSAPATPALGLQNAPAPISAPGAASGPQPMIPGAGGQPAPAAPGLPATPPGAGRRGRPGDPGANGPMPMAGPDGQVPASAPGGVGFPGAPGGPGAPGAPAAPGAPGASGFGAIAGPGGSAGSDPALSGNAAFARPATAVQAFLAALKAKDKDRLAQTTALRAATESAAKHQKIFAAIAEGSIADDELDEMSKALDGYQVVQVLPAYSTGRIDVLISKMDGRDRLQRKITTRKEKAGWKVLDVDSALEFKFIQMPRGRGGRRR